MPAMQTHTTLGYQMVKGSVPASAAQVVLNHHQRFDGSGYPARVDHATGEELPPLAGKQIPVFSRIAILADVYDAATTTRCYSAAKPPVQVLHEMRTRCRGFFDPVVEEAFYRTVPAFPIGQVVTLSNGVEAAVVDFNAEFPAAAEGAMPAGGRRPAVRPSFAGRNRPGPVQRPVHRRRRWPRRAAFCQVAGSRGGSREWCKRFAGRARRRETAD